MADIDLSCERVGHGFGRQRLFSGISFTLQGQGSLCVAGPNGSGKSTLLHILAGILEPRTGQVTWSSGGRALARLERHQCLGWVSPELQLYGELTVLENLRFFARLRRLRESETCLQGLVDRFDLAGERHKPYSALSSGQKQRLKYVAALLHSPAVLLLDEPTANLDRAGRELVAQVAKEQSQHGLLVVATNEEEEYRFGETLVRLRE